MSYYVSALLDLKVRDGEVEKVKTILRNTGYDDTFKVVEECGYHRIYSSDFKWSEGVCSLLAILAHYAEGSATMIGEDNAVWSYDLGDGELWEYQEDVEYSEEERVDLPRDAVVRVFLQRRYEDEKYAIARVGINEFEVTDKTTGEKRTVNEYNVMEILGKLGKKGGEEEC